MRVRVKLAGAILAAGMMALLAGLAPVLAGSNGQLLAMYDSNGNVYSATVYGFNQNCVLTTDTINDWSVHWFYTAPTDQAHDWYWQDWSTCGTQDVTVTGYYGTNLSGGKVSGTPWSLSPIPHSQSSSNWTSCQVDPKSSPDCVAGFEVIP